MNKSSKLLLTRFISLILLLIPITMACVFETIYDKNDKFYIDNAVLDLHNEDISDRVEGVRLNGEMEFYYNTWLISDKEEKEKDDLIYLPSSWVGKNINGTTLDSSGYASYRFKMINIKEGTSFSFNSDYYYSSFKIFVNSRLVSQSGNPSKISSTDSTSIRTARRNSITINSTTADVVIEVGNSLQGGLVKAPYIYNTNTSDEVKAQELLLFVVMGMVFFSLLFLSIMSFISNGVKEGLMFSLSSITLFLFWLFSGEGLHLLRLINVSYLSFVTFKNLSVLFFILFILLFVLKYYFKSKKDKKAKINYSIFALICLLCGISILLLYKTTLFLLPFLIMSIYTFIFTNINILKENTFSAHLDTLILFFFNGTMLLSICNDANLFRINLSGLLSLTLLILVLLFFISFIFNIFNLNKIETDKDKLLKEQEKLKILSLREQINPNTMFNTLAIIQDLYHQDINKGDAGIDNYSKSLRYNINSIQILTVTFEEEIDDVIKYFEFNSLRSNKNTELILNIEESEYLLPPLILRPLITIMMKHEFNEIEKDNNYIEIQSTSNKKTNFLKLIDHRNSYIIDKDTDEIQSLIERLKLTVKGQLIVTKLKNSTQITIIIPKKNQTM